MMDIGWILDEYRTDLASSGEVLSCGDEALLVQQALYSRYNKTYISLHYNTVAIAPNCHTGLIRLSGESAPLPRSFLVSM